MMDVEFGTDTSCVILSLMGVNNRPRKKLIGKHKRVLSDEYHRRAASLVSHVRRSSFKYSSFETSENCETSEASTAIGWNKRYKMSMDEEDMGNVVLDEKKASGGMGLVDELISGIYTSHNTARHYPPSHNLTHPSTSLRARSRKSSLSGPYADNMCEKNSADLFSTQLGGCLPKSQSSAASSVASSGGASVKGMENVNSEPTAESEAAVGNVHVEAKNGERLLPRSPDILGMPTSCFISKRNSGPLPAYLSVDATEQVCEIKQETSPYDLEDSFCENGSSMESDSFKSFEDKYLHSPDSVLELFREEIPSGVTMNLSEQAIMHHSFGTDPSVAWLGEIGTTVSSEEGREDQCRSGSTTQDDSKTVRISETREFKYLIEILTEAGFCRKNLMSCLDKWHTLESPLNPFVFEKVEKRYADKSWEASERELLFDWTNSWLEGILRRTISVSSRQVRARISDQFRHDIDEEALWSSLVKEGKEAKGKMTDDLLKSNLELTDLADFTETIIAEIERSTMDELIGEIVLGCGVPA